MLDINQQLITTANPWLAQDPETLMRLATSGASPEELTHNAAALAGMETLDRMSTTMAGLSDVAQRSIYGRMTEQQQRGLNQMGYAPPDAESDSPLAPYFGAAAAVADKVMSPVASVVGAPLGVGMDMLTWVGDVPAHFYRSIRQMEGWQQWVALGAAAAAGTALAVASGGTAVPLLAGIGSSIAGAGTLGTLAGVGGGALAAGVLATFPSAISNPTEWWDLMNPFGDTGVGRGERIFTKEAQQRSRGLLGNATHLDALARDIAADLDTYELVSELAGERGATDQGVLLKSLEKVAAKLADPGTPEYQRIFTGLNTLVQQPEFLAAMDELQKSKISFGRDVAGSFGLEEGDKYHGLVSGAADGLWLFAMDPTLAIGKVGTLWRASRRGLDFASDTAAMERLSKMVVEDRAVRATAEQIGRAIRTEDFTALPKSWTHNHTHLSEWKRQTTLNGNTLPTDDSTIFLKYLDDGRGLSQLLQGHGTVRGHELIRISTGADAAGWGKFQAAARNMQRGLTDTVLIDDLKAMSKEFGVSADLERRLPFNALDEAVDTQFTARTIQEARPDSGAYAVGEAIGQGLMIVPGGRSFANFIGAVTTMIPSNSAIALVDMAKAGKNNVQNATTDIPRFIETFGRHFNLPSFVRDEWLNTTMRQGTIGQRRQVLLSFMDSVFTAGGLKSTDEGIKLADEFVHKYKQAYGAGGIDEIRIGDTQRIAGFLPEQHQAVFMVMPDLRKMSEAVQQGHILSTVTKLTDHKFVETAMSRYIKPGWLLRIGFIPRASGEEMLALVTRMGSGSLLQEFGARSLAQADAAKAARTKLHELGRSKLDAADLEALRYDTVGHLRPFLGMMERLGWEKPQASLLNNYSEFIRNSVENGLGFGFTERMPTFLDNVLLGKDKSLRHMLANGVSPELRLNADLWVLRHADPVMKSISASNASQAEKAHFNPDGQRMLVETADDGRRIDMPVVLSGERGLAGMDDLSYDPAVHRQVGEVFADAVLRDEWADALSTYLPPEMSLTENQVADALSLVDGIESHELRQLALEMVDVDETSLRALAETWDDYRPELRDAIIGAITRGQFDTTVFRSNLDDAIVRFQHEQFMAESVDDAYNAKKFENLTEEFETMIAQTDVLDQIVETFGQLDVSEASWLGAAMSRQASAMPMPWVTDGPQRYDLDAIRAGANPEVQGRPDFVLMRGIPDMSTTSITPEGDMIVAASAHKQWDTAGADAVSFTTDPKEALAFASKRGAGLEESAMTGAVIEIDGEWLLKEFGLTMDDLNASPQVPGTVAMPRGDGPYFYGHSNEYSITEVALALQKQGNTPRTFRIPKNKWRFQSTDEMKKFSDTADPGAYYDFMTGTRATEILGRPVEEVVPEVNKRIDDLIESMSPAEQADLVDMLNANHDEWANYYQNVYSQNVKRPKSILIDTELEAYDDTGQAVIDKLAALRSDLGELAPAFEKFTLSSPGQMFDDAVRERVGLPLARALDPSVQGGYDGATGAAQLSQMGSGLDVRGQGSFNIEATQQWSPIHRDFKRFRADLENRIAAKLADPNNQMYTRYADQLLKMPDGSPIATPAASGLAYIYTPIVPAESNNVLKMLSGEMLPPDVTPQQHSLLTNMKFHTDSRNLNELERTLGTLDGSGHSFQIETEMSELFGLLDEMAISRAQADELTETTVDHWERITDLVEQLDTNTMRTGTYEKMAEQIIAQGSKRSVPMGGLEEMDPTDLRNTLASALEHIDRNRHAYAEPVSLALESMAFNDPRVAQWVTHMLSDTLDVNLPTTVGQMTVPRQAVLGNSRGGNGIRVGGRSTVGNYWQLDHRWQTHAVPREARKVHMRRYAGTPSIGSPNQKPEMIRDEIDFLIGASLQKGIQAWAKTIVDGTLNKQMRGVKDVQRVRAPDEFRKNGVARRTGRGDNVKMEALNPGDELASPEELFEIDEAGKEIGSVRFGDRRYFESEIVDSSEELMWGMLGPMVRDVYESRAGFAKEIPRDLVGNKSRQVGEVYDPDSYVRMTRSRVSDVRREPEAALPNSTITELYTRRSDGIWDRIVRWGFDTVIGPSIDAIVRKPMAFHYFSEAMSDNRRKMGWLLDNNLIEVKLTESMGDVIEEIYTASQMTPEMMADLRLVAKSDGIELAADNIDDTRQFMLGLGEDSKQIRAKLLDKKRIAQRKTEAAIVRANPGVDGDELTKLIDKALLKADGEYAAADRLSESARREILAASAPDTGIGSMTKNQSFVNTYHEAIPDELWSEGLDAVQSFIDENKLALFSRFTDEQFSLLSRARNNLKTTLNQAEEMAAMRAVENVVPFLDSHEERSMFAEYGRNFLPFWYAEENFIKRWARTIAVSSDFGGLDTIRKAQLTYMGLRSAGIVRTDESGNDWVVYPGSGLLSEAVSKIMPGGGIAPGVGVLMQARTDSMLPGVNSNFGGASPSPFIAMPITMVTSLFPESQEIRRAVLGDIGASSSAMGQFVPGTIRKAWEVFYQDEDSSVRYASAMAAAIAYDEAAGNGLPDSATPDQMDEYLDKIRNHARIIMVSQMIGGFIVPGAPSTITTGETWSSWKALSGVGIDDPGQITSALYREYVSNAGIEEGTAAFLAAFPQADLEDIINPLALTTSKSDSASRAPLPATRTGMKWYNDNEAWVNAMPEAGAWFMPQDNNDTEDFDYYSYAQQLSSGLRKQRTPGEFLKAIKFRQGATPYFEMKDMYDQAVLKVGDNQAMKNEIDAVWSRWQDEFLTANPIFHEELLNGDSRQRRHRSIEQLRYAVDDPAAPDSPYTTEIRRIAKSYDSYVSQLRVLADRRDAKSEEKKRQIKSAFAEWVEGWKIKNPQLIRLWSTVYQPEAGLPDTITS